MCPKLPDDVAQEFDIIETQEASVIGIAGIGTIDLEKLDLNTAYRLGQYLPIRAKEKPTQKKEK